MSLLNSHWHIKNSDPSSSLLQKLLSNRGLKSDEEIERFFHPTAQRDFHDPFLMPDMKKAVERIGRAIESSERIMIFGDYDVDGITGCAILMRALRKLRANVSYRLPHRIEDGYGLRNKFIDEFYRLGVKVIITVDNGISCAAQVRRAQECGMDVIITDHHTIPAELPPAYATVHPKLPGASYPCKELTGAGVALKLAQALFKKRLRDDETEIFSLLDLACMGTIADLGELRGENRFIVKEGLRVLGETRWPGLSRLKERAGLNGIIDVHDVGFVISPRLNAAGRLAHPQQALRLLLLDNEQTASLALELEELNRRRQKLVEELLKIACNLAEEQTNDPLLTLSHSSFHAGVIGLLAARISEQYRKPTIVMEDRGEVLVGSCRTGSNGSSSINMVEALTEARDLLTNFGGHAAAAGFEIKKEKLKAFEERLKLHTAGKCATHQAHTVAAECEIDHSDISEKTLSMLEWFKPHGVGNETPRFVCRGLEVREVTTVGSEKKHLKMTAALNNGEKIECIGFRLGQYASIIKKNTSLDVLCEIELNKWNGSEKKQLVLLDIKNSILLCR